MLMRDFEKIQLNISLTNPDSFPFSDNISSDKSGHVYTDPKWINPKEICKIVSEFAALGIKKIHLEGIDSPDRKDAKRIIQTISKLPVELSIISNGILINDFFNTFLQSGIKSLNLKLDTLRPDKFFAITKLNFEKVLFNIHLLLANNFFVNINVKLMKGINEDEILDFVEWTKKLPLHIRFFEFIPSGENQRGKEKIISHQKVLWLLESFYRLKELAGENKSASKTYKVAGFAGSFEILGNLSQSRDNWRTWSLTTDGKLTNPLLPEKKIDLLTPLRKRKDIRNLIIESVKV